MVHIAAPSAAGGVVIALLLFLFLARRRSKRKSKYNDGDPIYAEVGGRDGLTRFLFVFFSVRGGYTPGTRRFETDPTTLSPPFGGLGMCIV